ncbi:MAG: hypothetical protein AAES65_15760 [Candidatus Thiodiazotropha sp. (ex. Lucinoma kazani)]
MAAATARSVLAAVPRGTVISGQPLEGSSTVEGLATIGFTEFTIDKHLLMSGGDEVAGLPGDVVRCQHRFNNWIHGCFLQEIFF